MAHDGERASEADVNAPSSDAPSDLSLRVARRLELLGMSREDFARRTRMDLGYLAYFERSPEAIIPPDLLFRIAKALETTPAALLSTQPVSPVDLAYRAKSSTTNAIRARPVRSTAPTAVAV